MRWSEVAPRALAARRDSPPGSIEVDPEGLRCALDALLENAVKYTRATATRSSFAHARQAALS